MTVTRGGADGAPKPKKHKDRGVKFNEKHSLKYGLSVCSRNVTTSTVESVMCKFCVAFGKESAMDPNRKRRATSNIKYFRQPFRADHYLSHMEINHKQKWAEYEQAAGPEKEKFFDSIEEATLKTLALEQQQLANAQNAKNALKAQSAQNAQNAPSTQSNSQSVSLPEAMASGSRRMVRLPASEIEKRIVEELVGGLFFNPSDEAGVSKAQALAVFRHKEGTENYEVVVKNQRLYDLAVKFVSCGASFRLASRMVQSTKEETKLGCYNGCSEHKVAGYVRTVLASNLQKLALLMRSCWAYSIATDAAVHQGTSYLDFRVRLWQNDKLQDFHLLTIPSFDQHPAPAVIQRLEKCLDILDPQWRGKLLGTTTNGGVHTGRNTGMTGSQQGLSARLTTLVSKPNFYLIWCGVHQLELVVKNCVAAFCQKAFYNELVAVLGMLRQEPLAGEHQEASGLDAAMSFPLDNIPDVTTSFSTTRGFAEKLMETLKWLMEHRVTIVQRLQTAFPASVPSSSWWVCVAVAHRVMAEIAYFMKKLLGMESGTNLVSEQVQELCKLALIMADVVGARRDLWDARDNENACAAGSFLLTYQNAQQFIQNEGGPLAIETFDTLRGVERLHIAKSVAHFAVDLIAGVAAIAQEGRHYCAEDVGVLVNPPCVMPIDLYEMGPEAFLRVLYEQEPRLRETMGDEEMKAIQKEFDEFVMAVKREPLLNGVMKKHGRETDVSFAWSCIGRRFLSLQKFVGGLASVVPEISSGTLASGLAGLNWEKPDYRQTMVDFALEGILHAKQKMEVDLVDSQSLQHSIPNPVVVRIENTGSSEEPANYVGMVGGMPASSATAASVASSSSTGATLDASMAPMPLGSQTSMAMPLGMHSTMTAQEMASLADMPMSIPKTSQGGNGSGDNGSGGANSAAAPDGSHGYMVV